MHDKEDIEAFSPFSSDEVRKDFFTRLLDGLRSKPGWPQKYILDLPNGFVEDAVSLFSPAHVGDDWLLIIKPEGNGYRITDVPTGLARQLRFVLPESWSTGEPVESTPLLDFVQRLGKAAGNKDKVKALIVKKLRQIEGTMRGDSPGEHAAMAIIRSMFEEMVETWPSIHGVAQAEADSLSEGSDTKTH